ncbi:ABC transporter permease subunit [Halegenticoccus tardaugens]|uniref:ABC transporter permease subunit n=1 Tax=Halegenticoccus tardaugens TaxID=2071624 RepID=UPI00100B7761|nr:ABC transporter permease subunit [Halegenticoccus tardaugens]
MTWTVVAKKDFLDARLSWGLWVLAALFVLFSGAMAYAYTRLAPAGVGTGEADSIGLLVFLSSPVTLFVSIAAIVICYKSIAGETESGSGKLLLSLPHTRRDVLVGKIAGRTAVLVIPLLVGLGVALAIVLALYAEFSAVDYLGFTLLTVLFAFVYVGLIVSVSALTRSTSKALAGALSLFVILEVLWGVVPLAIVFVTNGFSLPPNGQLPEWAQFVSQLAPSAAYGNAILKLLPGSAQLPAGLVPASDAVYFSGWFSLAVLLAWLLVPLGFGIVRYQQVDL